LDDVGDVDCEACGGRLLAQGLWTTHPNQQYRHCNGFCVSNHHSLLLPLQRQATVESGPCANKATCTADPAETWKSPSLPLHVSWPLAPATALSILPNTPSGSVGGTVRSGGARHHYPHRADCGPSNG